MKLLKSKKAVAEATERSMIEIIGWIILFVLVLFIFAWYSGLWNKIIAIFKSFF